MKAESTVKPPLSLKFTIEESGGGKCNVHLYENIEETITKEGDVIYTYDVYTIENIPYHSALRTNIENERAAWLEMAKASEEADPEYTEIQRLEQDITDQMIENIEQGQYITELELLIIGGR